MGSYFLTDDLQGVGNATGHNSGIENRNFAAKIPARSGLSKISAGIPERIPQTRNWIQDIFTPSTSGEKWSIVRICRKTGKHRSVPEVRPCRWQIPLLESDKEDKVHTGKE